jgi:hypothetical protein
MIEHNNLRISLLEQRNKRFREILIDHVTKYGNPLYSKYHPVSSSTVIFNKNAITPSPSRPSTANSTSPPTAEMTYIIGTKGKSRAISALSVRLLRPASGKSKVDQALQLPIFSKLNPDSKSIDIEEGPKTKYPPTRFPFLAPNDPLGIYDSALLEISPPPIGVSSGIKNQDRVLRSSLKGSRPSTAAKRPSSAVSFQWSMIEK